MDHTAIINLVYIKMFDKVKFSKFEKVKKVVILDDYNFLTAGLQNVLLLYSI